MRYPYSGFTKDQNGRIIQSAVVSVYLAGSSTAANIYAAETGGTAVNSVTSDSNGQFSFWVDDGDYAVTQKFKISVSKAVSNVASYGSVEVDNTVIFAIQGGGLVYYPDPSVSDHANGALTGSIQSLLTAIGTSNPATIELQCRSAGGSTYIILQNADWSAYTNVTFKIMPGAVISHGTFTLNIPNLTETTKQVFSGTGTVTLSGVLGYAITPQIFGALGDNSNDDADALISWGVMNNVRKYLPVGTYLTSKQVTTRGIITGYNRGSGQIPTIKATSAMSSVVVQQEGEFSGILIDAASLATYGLIAHNTVNSKLTRAIVQNALKDGIYCDPAGNNNGYEIDTCIVKLNGTAYSTGNVSTVAADQTITFSGVDLTTLNLRAGVDYIKITGETVPNMIITVTDATHAEVYPAPIATLNNVAFSIKSGNGIHLAKAGNNSSILIKNTIVQSSVAAGIMDLSLYGATCIKNIMEINYFGRVIGRRGLSEITYSATDIAGYYESSTYADIYLEYADGCTVINPLTPTNIKSLLALDYNFIGNGGIITSYVSPSKVVVSGASGNLISGTNTNAELAEAVSKMETSGTWSPSRTGFTESGGGTITVTGKYVKIGHLVWYGIKIVCSGGAVITSVAGTSYIFNLPFTLSADGNAIVTATCGNTAVSYGNGYGANATLYPPSWTGTANYTYSISVIGYVD